METTEETPHTRVATLVTGHFHSEPGYTSWRTCGTDDWLLIYTLGGRGRFGRADGGKFVSAAHTMVLIKPGTRHDYGVADGASHWELLWAHFHPRAHWHDWLCWPETGPGVGHLTLDEPIVRGKIVSRFRDAHRLATGALRGRDLFALNALEETLLWCGTQNPLAAHARLDPRVQAAMDYLCRHLGDKIPMDTLAGECQLSASRLSHLFRAETGVTPQQFLERERLQRAQQLLDWTPLSVGAIAAAVGFDNPFYFTLRFKRLTGRSPREWRQRGALEPTLETETLA